MGRVDTHHRGHHDDRDDGGSVESGNLAADLYLDKLEALAEDLRDRLAALELAAQRLAADIYGLSVESRHSIPDGGRSDPSVASSGITLRSTSL